MALRALLKAGAEAIAMGRISQLAKSYDRGGRGIRAKVTDRIRADIRQGVESRIGRELSGQERRELNQIVDASDQANRQAMKLDRAMGRPPSPSEIGRLPGTGRAGGDRYSYTVVITSVDPQTGQRFTTTQVITSDRIEEGDIIRSRAVALAERGQWTTRQGTDASSVGSVVVESAAILSVYRGAPDV